MDKIKSGIENKISDFKINKIVPTKDEFDKVIQEIVQPNNRTTQKEKIHTLEAVYAGWLKYKISLNIFSKGRIQRYKSVYKHLLDFQSSINKRIYLNNLEENFLDLFQNYIIDKKLRNNTILSIIKVVKLF